MTTKSLLLAALAVPALAFGRDPEPVNPPAPIPAGITSVSPVQGFIDLSGDVNPLGVKEITLTFPSNDIVYNPDVKSELYREGTLYTDASTGSVDAMGTPAASVLFACNGTKPGWYEVRIPEGQFTVAGAPSPAVNLFYEILSVCTITPAPGVVDQVTDICMDFRDMDYAELDLTEAPTCLAFVNINGVEVTPEYTLNTILEQFADGWAAFIKFGEGDILTELTYPGTYKINIPAGLVTARKYGDNYENDPKDYVEYTNPRFNFVYTISAFPAPSIEPAEGKVDGFLNFTLKMADGFTLLYADNMTRESLICPVNEDDTLNTYDVVCNVKATGWDVDKNEVYLVACKSNGLAYEEPVVPAPGDYALQLGDKLFQGKWKGYSDKEVQYGSAQFRYDYTVGGGSGVCDVVEAPATDFTVYNLQGVRVAKAVSAEAVNALPKGLYIVNGKKMMIK